MSEYLEVAVPLPVPGTFTYRHDVPLAPGAAVKVPFGGRRVAGWVVGAADPRDDAKPVDEVLEKEPAFDAEQLALYRFVAAYYHATLGDVIATATPAGVAARVRRVYAATPAGIERVATDCPPGARGIVLRELISRPRMTKSTLTRRVHEEVEDAMTAMRGLLADGLAEVIDEVIEGPRDEETWIVGTGAVRSPELSKRAVTATTVLGKLPMRAAELPAGAVASLVRRGLARREARPRTGAVGSGWISPERGPRELNRDQAAAVEGVAGAGTYLLHGVTGSGKTEVYLALAARAVATGGQALILVPEIALTPQLQARVEARFPGRVAVLHSGLTGAERLRQWRLARSGDVDVVVGARSAVFAPFRALGLVVVDEEHDDAYKQDDGVRYHARDLAVVRAQRAGAPCVLGSATPSLESWHNAVLGRYRLLRLPVRATPRPVPKVELVDLRALSQVTPGKLPLLADVTWRALSEVVSSGGKAIVLHNRRGYATFVECPGCGACYECPSCGIALVLHQRTEKLHCHWCGFSRGFSPNCPRCDVTLEVLGRGTERVAEEIAELFPGVPIGRLDADTTDTRGAHARILGAFSAGETRILVGTQIVAKGHDFPGVHLAVVLGVDHALGMPDFRAAERVFSLVTQVAGRAGRGEVAGRVLVQTHHADHPVFAAAGDMDPFAERELNLRRLMGVPPYSRLALVRLESTSRPDAKAAAEAVARAARAVAGNYDAVDVLGPAAAPLAKLVGRWRFQVVLRGRAVKSFRAFLEREVVGWKVPSGVRKIVDVDPRSMA